MKKELHETNKTLKSKDETKTVIKAKKINSNIAPIVDAFLKEESYQDIFKDMAFALGYKGEDPLKIKQTLFTADENGEIGFILKETSDLFTEYQAFYQLVQRDPYKTKLKESPAIKQDIMQLVKKAIAKQDITDADLAFLSTKQDTNDTTKTKS